MPSVVLNSALYEQFAQLVVVLGNQSDAFKLAYPEQAANLDNYGVSRHACRLANKPDVAARIVELMREAMSSTIMTVRELAQHYADIATADPAELSRLHVINCRYCHGCEHKYQWVDVQEWMTECALALDQKREPPDCDGGFGFRKGAEPVDTCGHCLGDGIPQAVFTDTLKLSPKARRLFKGVKVTAKGEIEVLQHDQMAALGKLGDMMNAFKDISKLIDPDGSKASSRVVELPADTSPERALEEYNKLL